MAFPVKVATPVKDTPAKPADLANAQHGAMSDPKKALAKGLTGMKSPGKSLAKKK